MATYDESTGGTLPFYNEAYQRLIAETEARAKQQMGMTPPPQTVAGFTPMQEEAFKLAGSSVGQYQPWLQQAQQFATQAGQGAQFDPSQVQQYLNPYMQGVVGEIGRLGQERLQQELIPGVTGAMGGLGQFGSARQAALLADVAGRSQREILGKQAEALNTGYNQAMSQYQDWTKMGLGAQQQAASQLGELAKTGQGMTLADIGQLTTAGKTQQELAQQQANLPFTNWMTQQQYPWQVQNQWANLFKQAPQQQTSWNTAFKRGGLVKGSDFDRRVKLAEKGKLRKYAKGGTFDEPYVPSIAWLLEHPEAFDLDNDWYRLPKASRLQSKQPRFAKGGEFKDPSAFEMTYNQILDLYPDLKDDPTFRELAFKTALKESGGDPTSVGVEIPSGMHRGDRAQGMFGIMPKTAMDLGYDLSNYDANLAGMHYLADNYLDFDRDPFLASVAHIGGPGAARRARRTGSAGVSDRVSGLSADDYARQVTNAPIDPNIVGTPQLNSELDNRAREIETNPLRTTNVDPYYRQVADALAQREAFKQRAMQSAALQPSKEKGMLYDIGRAMMNAEVRPGAGWAGALGSTGKAYFDQRDAREQELRKLELARLGVEKEFLPDVSQIKPPPNRQIVEHKDGSLWSVSVTNPNDAVQVKGPGAQPGKFSVSRDPITGDAIVLDELTGKITQGPKGLGFRIPEGYMPDPNRPGGILPRPGSKAEREATEAVQLEDQQLMQVEQTAQIAKDLLGHGGREMATGWESMFPKVAGTRPVDYAAKLETLEARNWLNNIRLIKGAGAITDTEGKKLAAAEGNLALNQSDAAHAAALKSIIEVAEAQAARMRRDIASKRGGAPSAQTQNGTTNGGKNGALSDPLGLR